MTTIGIYPISEMDSGRKGAISLCLRKPSVGNQSNPTVSTKVATDGGRDKKVRIEEVYFLVAHFLSNGPCKGAAEVLKKELIEHNLLRGGPYEQREGLESLTSLQSCFSLTSFGYSDMKQR